MELTILGGGPAGLGVAFYAERAGLGYVLHEKSSALGGMCRTFQTGAHRWDSGAHRLHDRDPEITRDLRTLMGDELLRVDAPSQILTRGRFVDFPPTPYNALRSYGAVGAVRAGLDLAASRWRAGPAHTFEDFAHARFGKTLARDLLVDYSEKLWGLPASELSPDVATRRLGGMSLGSLLVELLRPHEKAAHLDGAFLYPRYGYGTLAARIAEALSPEALRLGSAASSMSCREGSITDVAFEDGASARVEGRLVSTLPLTVLARLLHAWLDPEAAAAAARLRFRHVRLVFLRIAQRRVTSNASIYVPNREFRLARVTEPKNRSAAMAPANETALVAEVPGSPGDSTLTLPEEDLASHVIDALVELGLIRRVDVIDVAHASLPHAYPVYSLGYEDDVRRALAGMKRFENLDTIGRGGVFRYGHLHDQLRSAKDYVAAWARARS